MFRHINRRLARWKQWQRAALGLGLGLLFVHLIFFVDSTLAERKLEAARQHLKSVAPLVPVSLQEIEDHGSLPPAEDSTPILIEAINHSAFSEWDPVPPAPWSHAEQPNPNKPPETFDPWLGDQFVEPLPPSIHNTLVDFVAKNQQALDLLNTLPPDPAFHLPIQVEVDGLTCPNIDGLRYLRNTLLLQIRILADEQDADAVSNAHIKTIQVMKAERESMALFFPVISASALIPAHHRSVEQSLSRVTLSSQQLTTLRQMQDALDASNLVEQDITSRCIEMIHHNEALRQRLTPYQRLFFYGPQFARPLADTLNQYADIYEAWYQAQNTGQPFQPPEEEPRHYASTCMSFSESSFILVTEMTQQLQQQRALVDTLLAAYQYKNTHGRFPTALDQLVPEFIDAVPQDTYNPGQPIQLNTTPFGIALYSIGRNTIDDHGLRPGQPEFEHLEEGNHPTYPANDDIVFWGFNTPGTPHPSARLYPDHYVIDAFWPHDYDPPPGVAYLKTKATPATHMITGFNGLPFTSRPYLQQPQTRWSTTAQTNFIGPLPDESDIPTPQMLPALTPSQTETATTPPTPTETH